MEISKGIQYLILTKGRTLAVIVKLNTHAKIGY